MECLDLICTQEYKTLVRYGLGVAVALLAALPVGAVLRDASAAPQAAAALEVRATANIFGAGRSAPPAGPGGVGTLPPVYLLPRGTDRVLTLSSVTGKITCCKTGSNLYNGPGGRSDYGTNLTGVRGVSGVKSRRSMFLAGVFLGAARERESPPTKTHTLTPELGQVFYVGNGQGGDGPLRFDVPDGATRLFLGIADGYNFVGKPSYYGDNAGSFNATLHIKRPAPGRRDVVFTVLAKNELRASKKNELLADARLGGAGRIVDFRGGSKGRGALSLTLVWLQRDDAHLVLRPTGVWHFHRAAMGAVGTADVVKSDEPRCPKGSEVLVSLRERPPSAAAITPGEGCEGLDRYLWNEPESEIDVNVREISAGG